MKKYSIIIPTYNHCDDLLKPCIESILAFTDLAETEIVVSANGCTDNTQEYLVSLANHFEQIGKDGHLKVFWSDSPLGYAKATNEGIVISSGEYVVLLNNDTVLLPQQTNSWLEILTSPFKNDVRCGISSVVSHLSPPANANFAIFFCVMIHRNVFNTIGLLNEYYGKGAGEDTEFCIEAERAGFKVVQAMESYTSNELNTNTGSFPIWHKGEGTVHDEALVPDFSDVILQNSLKLAKKYHPAWFKQKVQEINLNSLFWLEYSENNSRLEYMAAVENKYSVLNQRIKGKEVVDIGAKAGIFSIFAERLGASKIIAVDPLTINISEINLNTELSKSNRVSVLQRFAGVKNLRQRSYLKTQYLMHQDSIESDFVNVPEITFDEVSQLVSGNAVLKVECDGSEISFLTNSTASNFDKFSTIVLILNPNISTLSGYFGIIENCLMNRNFSLSVVNSIGDHYTVMVWESEK